MASEPIKGGAIDTGGVAPDQKPNLDVQKDANGSTITNTGEVKGLGIGVDTNVTTEGGVFVDTTVTFGEAPDGSASTFTARNTVMTKTVVTGSKTDDAYNVGGANPAAKSTAKTKTFGTSADLREGSDSVSFFNKSLDKGSSYKLGDGIDSVTFGKGSTSKSGRVSLGANDKSADIVSIDKKAKVKDLKITDFGKEDTLKIGGKTYDYNELQDKTFKNITIKFD